MNVELKLKRILFATDFLESSRLALDYAVAFAHHFQAAIVILHVVELSQAARAAEVGTSKPSMMRQSAQKRLDALAFGVRRTGLQVETSLQEGTPCERILWAVGFHRADLLVLGIHGVHRGVEHLLIGSNTEKILLAADCPTLTIGAHVLTGVDLGLQIEEVLYFSDFTPEATAAAPYALFLGKAFGVPVEVCLLTPTIAENDEKLRRELAEEYCAAMQRVLSESDSDWCSPSFLLERGMAVEQLIKRAQHQSAGLIVLGVHTESQLGRHLHTSFAYHLLAKATCPVLSIRHRAASSETSG